MGAEGDELTGIDYARLTGNYFRTSTLCLDSPHVLLLKKYKIKGIECLNSEQFSSTEYFKNALEAIHYVFDYFPYIKKPGDIIKAANRFILQFEKKDISFLPSAGHNKPSDIIEVRPIIGTEYYQLKSGNHRVAFAIMDKQKTIKAKVFYNQTTQTYFQDIVKKVVWDEGKLLYQPIELPEFSKMTLVRKSVDRVIKINDFLHNQNYNTENQTILDVGSYFGYFLNEYEKMGLNAFGVERDYMACEMAEDYFKIETSSLFKMPIEVFIEMHPKIEFDYVSFLSVLHHFAMNKSYIKADYLFQRLSKMTKKVMFFETGEQQENWFQDSLKGWDNEYIEDFIRNNSDFTQIVRLGRDSDNVGDYYNCYNRMLYALIK